MNDPCAAKICGQIMSFHYGFTSVLDLCIGCLHISFRNLKLLNSVILFLYLVVINKFQVLVVALF